MKRHLIKFSRPLSPQCPGPCQVDPYDAEDYEHQYNEPAPITLDGCVAWFKAEEAAMPWPSVVGSHEGKVVGNKAGGKWEVEHRTKVLEMGLPK